MKPAPVFEGIIILASLLLLSGIVSANTVFTGASVTVIIVMFTGVSVRQPSGTVIKRTKIKDIVFSGEVFSNTIEISINSGTGIIIVSDRLPPNFELVGGSNIKILWKGLKPRKDRISYSIVCKAAGTYHLDCISLESRHFLNLRVPLEEINTDLQVLEVKPKILDLKKIRNTAAASRIPLPLGAVSKTGIPTLEFKELRQYNPGDPFKYINWKATARNVCRGNTQPVINEYEKEGRKVVWIFLDDSKIMRFGANIRNAADCSLEAVNGLADYYIKQNNIVALCTYNRTDRFIYPGSGKKQYHRILKCILKFNIVAGKTGDYAEKSSVPPLSLKETVTKYKGYISGNRPLCVIVTRLTGENADGLFTGIKEMSKYAGVMHGKLSVMVVNICGYGLLPPEQADDACAAFLESRNSYLARKIKNGVMWVDWDPSKGGFTGALLGQAVKS